MSTLSVNSIKDVQSFDFANTSFAGAYGTANSGYVVANAAFTLANTSMVVKERESSYNLNTTATGTSAYLKWLDGGGSPIGTPGNTAGSIDSTGQAATTSGLLLEYDALFNSAVAGKWKLQMYHNTAGGYPLWFRTQANGGWQNWNSLVHANYLGNVGIGTTSPSRKLHTVGTDSGAIALIAGSSYGLTLQSDASSGFRIEAADVTGVSSYQPLITSGSIQIFRTNGSERMRIDTNGKVGINTTAPQSQLAVVSNTSTAYVTTDGTYYSSPYPHELTIQNNQQNTTNTFCGIFFQAGQTAWQSGINAGRLSFVRDSNNSYGGHFTFSNRATADATMREVMRLDQGGRLTLPNHPAFHVYDATGADFASEAKNTNLTGVSWNNGSYYNTSTQRFTAPVAGYYYFYYRTNMSSARNPKQTVIYVNGSPKLRGYNYDTSTWSETAAIGIWYLAVNDYVEFYYQGDPDAGLTWNYAGGYLIG